MASELPTKSISRPKGASNTLLPTADASSHTLAPCVDEILGSNLQFEAVCVEWDTQAGFSEAFDRHRARTDEVDENDPDLVVSGEVHVVPLDQLNQAIVGDLPVTLHPSPQFSAPLTESVASHAVPGTASSPATPTLSGSDNTGADFTSKRRQKKQQGHKLRRAKVREQSAIERKASPFSHFTAIKHKPSTLSRYAKFERIACALTADTLPRSSGPSWIGKREKERGKKAVDLLETPDVETLVNLYGYRLIPYKPGVNRVVVDSANTMIVGHFDRPHDPTWDCTMAEAQQAFSTTRKVGIASGTFTTVHTEHRRGRFLAIPTGVSFGGGQKRPGNLHHRLHARRVLTQSLLKNKAIQRIAGYQSSTFYMLAPKLFRHYSAELGKLFDNHPELQHNFVNSVFPAASFNCGPASISIPHHDYNNLSFGLCAITAFGSFDYTRGGHLALDELKLVLEVPSGTTVIIPSAVIKHSNTPIQKGEERYSMAQYAAGGLFRWVAYGCKTSKTLSSTREGRDLKQSIDKEDGVRWADGLKMYSTIESFSADHNIKV